MPSGMIGGRPAPASFEASLPGSTGSFFTIATIRPRPTMSCTRVDVVCTASPSSQPQDATSKVILSNVQVLTSGTRLEQDQEKGKPMQVTVVTLLVYPDQAERLALASTEGKIQLALRNPLDQGAPETPGVKPAILLGVVKAPAQGKTVARNTKKSAGPVTPETPMAAPAPTVEMIRGDKRSAEVIK